MKHKDFAIFILTHGRADNVKTYDTLKKVNYTGDIYIVIDDNDEQADKYIENFGEDRVIIFSKEEIAKEFDQMDNFDDLRTVVYARNASFGIAGDLGLKNFMLLDDDYVEFCFRYNQRLEWERNPTRRFDEALDLLLDFYESIPAKSIALAQAGDYIGGRDNNFPFSRIRVRKCMNTFICSTERPFKFKGRINEDVNTYVGRAKFGDLFLTIPFFTVEQLQTQINEGGMTDVYLVSGTYVKSFYTVMVQPSSACVSTINDRRGDSQWRLHHFVKGTNTYPMIIRQEHKVNNMASNG